MRISFFGATHEVTGSMTLLEVNGRYMLVDCGMEQGRNVFENVALSVPPSEIRCVFLTHAHIDHSGNLPLLYKNGFRGTVYATQETCALCNVMLMDAAHIQESEAEWANRKAKRAADQQIEPVYTCEHAEGVLKLFRRCPYDSVISVLEGVELRFTDIGHLLGSAAIEVWMREGELERKMVFSGDVGNINQPLIKDPQPVLSADYLLIESTYGDRLHPERPDYVKEFSEIIQRTFDRGGNVVIPSFAVGRTQEILYFLREIKEKGMVKGHEGFPVYLDSPLAIKATNIFVEAPPTSFDEEMLALLRAGINPIDFPDLHICVTAEESKQINFEQNPCVIISASGMAEAGRIRHHLKHNLWRPEAMVLFVGYQSVGTLGRQLYDGVKTVRLFNETIAVKAEIRVLQAISGHADQAGLLTWINSFNPKPQKVFVTHGEEQVALHFEGLLKDGGYSTFVPYSGDSWELKTDTQLAYGTRELVDKTSKKQRKIKKRDTAMQDALDRLSALVQSAAGYSNKLKAKLAQQINDLVRRWED